MRRAALALALCLTACPGGDVCMGTGGVPVTSSFGIAGSPTTIELLLPVQCGNRMPTGVTVSVLGPSDENVPVDAGTPQSGTSGFTTDVTFTPTTPGGYHIAARFEPNLGLAQYDLIAAADRRDAGLAMFTIDWGEISLCDHVEVSPHGRLVCIGSNQASVFDTPASVAMTLPGTAAAEYADGVVWTADDQGVITRYVETDAGFVARESGMPGTVFSVSSLLPTANDVVVVGGSTTDASLLTPAADGGLDAKRLSALAQGPPDWRDQNVIAHLVPIGFMGPSLCTAALSGADAGCTTLSGLSGIQLFGMDSAGYYATQGTASGLGSFAFQIGPDGSQSLKLPGDWSSGMSLSQWEHAPILSSAGATDLVLNSSMGIEAYLNDATETLGQVCTHFAVVKSGSKARVVPRP